MKFTLTIECENAAFGTDTTDAADETARILRRIATRLEAGATSGKCMDLNGNSVGEFGFNTLLNPNRRKVGAK